MILDHNAVCYLSGCDLSPVKLSSVDPTLLVTGMSILFDLTL